MAKTIISCAMTGTGTPKSKNGALPTTPEQIAKDVYDVWKAGAAICHLHMRDDNEFPTMDSGRFRKAIKLIREKKDCDIIINCTSSGNMEPLTNAGRMEHFNTIPDIEMGSFDAGTINWGCRDIFENGPQFLEELAQCYIDRGIKPEVEIFDPGMIGNAKYYISKGLLKEPVYYQMVMNVLGGSEGTVDNLLHLVRQLPEGAIWSCTGIGTSHVPMMYAALALGGHIRVGLEDNIYFSKGVKATNVSLVERAVRVVKEFGNEVATPEEAREILGILQLKR